MSGFGHGEEHSAGYEVLWGQQGLIYGEYPGSKCGKYPAGQYSFEGDPEAVPVAPEWLLAEMRAAKTPETFIKNRTALDLSDRTEDEVAVIITECLDVIEQRGAGNRDHWVKVGMAIHSRVAQRSRDCTLWSAWSAKDVEFAEEWNRGNPCETAHGTALSLGRVGLGSLIWHGGSGRSQAHQVHQQPSRNRSLRLLRSTRIQSRSLVRWRCRSRKSSGAAWPSTSKTMLLG